MKIPSLLHGPCTSQCFHLPFQQDELSLVQVEPCDRLKGLLFFRLDVLRTSTSAAHTDVYSGSRQCSRELDLAGSCRSLPIGVYHPTAVHSARLLVPRGSDCDTSSDWGVWVAGADGSSPTGSRWAALSVGELICPGSEAAVAL